MVSMDVGFFGLWSAIITPRILFDGKEMAYAQFKGYTTHALSNEGLIATKFLLIAFPRLHSSYPSIVLFSANDIRLFESVHN